MLKRLYLWTIGWAETPHASWALFFVAFAEASFFPIPPDVLLITMALAAPKKSLRHAGNCTLGSILGGCLGYVIGRFLFVTVAAPLLNLYGAWETYAAISEGFQSHGFLFIFAAALTPIPYKVFTIAAGACSVNFGMLVAASVLGRGLRFFAIGVLFKFFGSSIKRFIDRYFNLLTVLFFLLLLLGFVCVRILTGCRHAGSAPVPRPGAGGQELPAAEPRAPAPAHPGKAATEPESRRDLKRGEKMLSERARARLIELARRTVEAAVKGEPTPQTTIDDPELQGKQGAFVTLKTMGRLRGCIGRFVSDLPLWQTVRAMAVASAAEDPRFVGNRITPAELDSVDMEISVLSPLKKVESPLDIELGTHGIYIRRGMRTGCFLPQVATETGWSKEEFLSNCCSHKAGLPADAWKDPETEVFIFTAEIIGED